MYRYKKMADSFDSIQERLKVVIAQYQEQERERKLKGELTPYEQYCKRLDDEEEERRKYRYERYMRGDWNYAHCYHEFGARPE